LVPQKPRSFTSPIKQQKFIAYKKNDKIGRRYGKRGPGGRGGVYGNDPG
jgi:hypothetical protein